MNMYRDLLNLMVHGRRFGGINTMTEKPDACVECAQASLVGMVMPLEQIAVDKDGPIFLYQCKKCGALWLENLRESYQITKEEAEAMFSLIEWSK